MDNRKAAALLLLGFMFLLSLIPTSLAVDQLKGTVINSAGIPIAGATIAAIRSKTTITQQVKTDASGKFTISVAPADASQLLAYNDDPTTPGWDYIPALANNKGSAISYDFTLFPAASIVITGDIQFVESDKTPNVITFSVTDKDGKILSPAGFDLRFSVGPGGLLQIPGIPSRTVIVPADQQFKVLVTSQILVSNKFRVINFNTTVSNTRSQGSKTELDVRPYVVAYNIGVNELLLQQLKNRLTELEFGGFYVVKEKTTTISLEAGLTEAKMRLEEGEYKLAGDLSKTSFIGLQHTLSSLTALQLDASLSIYIIISFAAVSAVTLGFLLANNLIGKTLISLSAYAPLLLILYAAYPGSSTLPLQVFLIVSILAIAAVMGFSFTVPILLSSIHGGEKVSLQTVIVPIFAIAKRSLTRRKLRFFLTLSSITVLVMSFVTLTSFSEGYGMVVSIRSNTAVPYGGVMIRASDWITNNRTYLFLGGSELDWLRNQPEVELLASKTMNPPYKSPITTISRNAIYGVVGLEQAEGNVTGISSAILEGKLPGPGEFAASAILCGSLKMQIGDSKSIKGFTLKLSGILDDTILSDLNDFDGDVYLPIKMVDINEDPAHPQWEPRTCDPSEVLFLDASTCMKMDLAYVSRIDLKLKPGVNADVFAQRLALEKGYQTWSDTDKGVRYASLNTYLEGTGLPLLIPWAIVVLNVIVTMLNSLHERRHEINILSSVGLNPAEIASIFVAEASIIGFIGGGFGYLLGVGLYKIMPTLGLALDVHMKVSAIWSLAGIGIAISAVLVGAIVALRSSVIITPSLNRKWSIEGESVEMGKPWIVPIPVKLNSDEVDEFTDYLYNKLTNLEKGDVMKTRSVKMHSEGDTRVLDFNYMTINTATNRYTRNTVRVQKSVDDEYTVQLESVGDREWTQEVGSLVRQIVMEWSNRPR